MNGFNINKYVNIKKNLASSHLCEKEVYVEIYKKGSKLTIFRLLIWDSKVQ